MNLNQLPHEGRGPQHEANPYVTPLENEGFFDAKEAELLPSFDTELIAIHTQKTDTFSRGSVYEEVAEMDDGTLYPVVTGLPNYPRSDTAVVFTTAWLTSSKGHNRHTLFRMMKAGYPTIMIGPESEIPNPSLSFERRMKLALSATQFKIAHDLNRILDEALPSLGHVREKEVIALGESRGAMLASGFFTPQYSGERKIAYGDTVAPCFARAAKKRELGAIALQLAPETLTLVKHGVNLLTRPAGKHYIDTLHKDPEYYAHQPFKIPYLLNGDAGILARAAMSAHPTTKQHIVIFKGDGWSQAEDYQKLYQPYDGVTLEFSKGYHLDIARKDTLDNQELRLAMIAEMRGYDGSFDAVDFKTVTHAHLEPTYKVVGRAALNQAA